MRRASLFQQKQAGRLAGQAASIYLYLLCHRSCHENAENTILSFQIGVAESGFVKLFVKISKAGSYSFGG
jgi:hypothetical protein